MSILSGRIQKVLNEMGGKGFILQTPTGKQIPVIISGDFQVEKLNFVTVRGDFIEHPTFGVYFKGYQIILSNYQARENLIKFLGSGVIKGLGVRYARKLVDFLEANNLNLEDYFKSSWKEIPGIPLKVTKRLKNFLDSLTPKLRIIFELTKLGLSHTSAEKVFNLYGELALEKIYENPYAALRKIEGFRFRKVDNLAKKLNLPEDNPERLSFAIEEVLLEALEQGHTCLPTKDLLKRAKKVCGEVSDTSLENCLENLIKTDSLREVDGYVGPKSIVDLEEKCAAEIFNRVSSTSNLAKNHFANLKESELMGLSDEQIRAIEFSLKEKLVLISGGPGTGKTTVISALWKILNGENVVLASPTGKAAQRLATLCNSDTFTLHRLLKLDPKSGFQRYTKNNPLPANYIIVDEASMIDTDLFYRLLTSSKDDTRLILVGDKDQLPPVSPGNVFHDLINFQQIPKVFLTRIFRRKEGSDISLLAQKIINSQPKLALEIMRNSKEIVFYPFESPDEASNLLLSILHKDILASDPYLTNTLIITPTNRGPLGADEINRNVANLISPRLDKFKFQPGDKVIQRKNNYDLNGIAVFNGDVGQILETNPTKKSVVVEFWDGRIGVYSKTTIEQLGLGYCLTVHKAQGQEADTVILVMDRSHFIILNRSLFYTAVTRAKKRLIVISPVKTVWTAILKTQGAQRFSLLGNFLSKKFRPA